MAKSNKKQVKKVVKKAKKNKFLVFLFVLVLIGVAVLGGMSYVKLNKVNGSLSVVEDKIDFFNLEISGMTFEWKVDAKYFPSLNELNRPTYSEGNKTTTISLVGKTKLNVIDKIVDSILKFGLGEKTYSKNVTIIAKAATNAELLSDYKDSLSMPAVVYKDMELRTSSISYDGITISWSSSNPLIMTNDGVITGVGEVTMTATIKKGDDTITKEFKIITSLVKDVVVVDYDFNDYSDSTYVNKDQYQDIELTGATSKDGGAYFRLKNDTEDGIIATLAYDNYKKVQFSYAYAGSSAGKGSYTKNSYVELLVSNDNENFELLTKETLADGEIHDFSFDFPNETSGYLRIKLSTEYAESFIIVDDLYVERFFGSSDVISALQKEIPTKLNKNYDFPLTTPYGGKVTYSSNNEAVLSNLGAVKEVTEPTVVKYNVTVTGFDFPVTFSVDIKVVGPSSVEPLEIRFIDLNKNGGNSDCGESTYIRLGNIDVLIDAGDNYNQTFENVKACINEYSLDKELDYVIATHPDSDHIGGMDDVIKEFKVLHLITFVENSGDTTGVFNSYKEAYTAEGCEVCYVIDSYNNVGNCKRRIELGTDVYIDIINTTFYELDANASNDNNGRSIVCVLNAYGTRVLFTGDAENLGRDIESATKDEIGNIDILKVVHHGTKNGCSQEYLKAIDPEVAIICNGNYLGNKHGHPTYEAISSLYSYDPNMLVYTITGGDGNSDSQCEKGSSFVCKGNSELYNVDRNGTILIVVDDNGYTISSENYGTNPLQIKDTKFYQAMLDAYN